MSFFSSRRYSEPGRTAGRLGQRGNFAERVRHVEEPRVRPQQRRQQGERKGGGRALTLPIADQ